MQSDTMMDVVDLDAAAKEVEDRFEPWRRVGLTVGAITWRDQGDGWPPSFKTVRADVKDPDSIGVALGKGDQEGEVVLFRGGWCDFVYWSGDPADDPVQDAPGYPDQMTIDGFGAVLDRLADQFR
ncbi:MAG: hypothetical protein AAF081_09135 [Actinomycetota bacterium]